MVLPAEFIDQRYPQLGVLLKLCESIWVNDVTEETSNQNSLP
jgi:hypothetical protein